MGLYVQGIYRGDNMDRNKLVYVWIGRMRSGIKLSIISLLLIFILCSCSKDNSKIYDDVDAVSQSADISEEALSKVKDEVKILTGCDDVETSELFNIENTYYIKVKIHDLMLHSDYIQAGDGEYTAVTMYTDTALYSIEKISGNFYEIWRYENGDLKRILYNMEDVVYSQDDDKIIKESRFLCL